MDGEGAGAGATAGVVSGGGAVEGGAAEGLGDLVLGGSVGGEAVGGETLILLLAAALDKALLMLPLPQPAARHPAARIAKATASLPSVLLIADPSVNPPSHPGRPVDLAEKPGVPS